jgi:Na+/H+ antiporter NhaD/arsenite permease-like protein
MYRLSFIFKKFVKIDQCFFEEKQLSLCLYSHIRTNTALVFYHAFISAMDDNDAVVLLMSAPSVNHLSVVQYV